MKNLSTERLSLVRPTLDHVDRIAEYCRDEQIGRWTVVPSPYSKADAEYFIRCCDEGFEKGIPAWVILLDDNPIGQIDFKHPMAGGGRNEVGFLMDPNFRGQGYMTEALKAVAEYWFDEGGLALGWKCWIIDGETNWASAKVAWKAGFTFDGVTRADDYAHGRMYDTLSATLLKGEPMEPTSPWFGPTDIRPAVPSPSDPEALVRQFHETYAMPISGQAPNVDIDRLGMRMALIAEEFTELVGAVYGPDSAALIERAYAEALEADGGQRDTVEAADALGDLIYVIYGMALETGISLPDVLAEIQDSNLSKLGADGQPIYREDGKVLKGPNYFPPNIAAVLEKARISL